jgi:hypothetical protein
MSNGQMSHSMKIINVSKVFCLFLLMHGVFMSYSEAVDDCKVVLQTTATAEDAREFRAQVTEFLDGVVNFDGAPFFKHLKREHFVQAILPASVYGWIIENYDEYVAFQQAWNKKKELGVAKFRYSLVKIHLDDPNHGFVVMKVIYEDRGADGRMFLKNIIITDTFVRDGGIWYMRMNQNTVLTENSP